MTNNNNNNKGRSFLSWYGNILRNPKYRWWVVLGTLAYLISPIDISPDIFPIIGQIDDVAILMLLLGEAYQIALEWIAERRARSVAADSAGQQEPTPSANPTSSANATEKTVDVEAVSMD
ncbi:MAG: YkvA family protein [Cyanobacteriota bacterium]|nr:YkvA family protein [Cyanobacteriota bacterium]